MASVILLPNDTLGNKVCEIWCLCLGKSKSNFLREKFNEEKKITLLHVVKLVTVAIVTTIY